MSLHKVDAIVSRTLGGLLVGTVLELVGISLAVILTAAATRRPIPGSATWSRIRSTRLEDQNV